jgi:CelD/BcsL family acetyltransferase involved in cellulose biosynthesis
VEIFLQVEASGWKGRQGTALASHAGDTTFIRRATAALAAHGACEIATLHAGGDAVAAGILLRHLGRAFFFKIGIDERFAKLSPGVQLTLDITRHLCGDPAIASADATTGAEHPMIGPIWRQHTPFGDVLLPLAGERDPATRLVATAMGARQRLRGYVHRLRRKG